MELSRMTGPVIPAGAGPPSDTANSLFKNANELSCWERSTAAAIDARSRRVRADRRCRPTAWGGHGSLVGEAHLVEQDIAALHLLVKKKGHPDCPDGHRRRKSPSLELVRNGEDDAPIVMWRDLWARCPLSLVLSAVSPGDDESW